MDYIKVKKALHSKANNRVKRKENEMGEWEKIFADHKSDKGLIIQIHKGLGLNSKKTT